VLFTSNVKEHLRNISALRCSVSHTQLEVTDHLQFLCLLFHHLFREIRKSLACQCYVYPKFDLKWTCSLRFRITVHKQVFSDLALEVSGPAEFCSKLDQAHLLVFSCNPEDHPDDWS